MPSRDVDAINRIKFTPSEYAIHKLQVEAVYNEDLGGGIHGVWLK